MLGDGDVNTITPSPSLFFPSLPLFPLLSTIHSSISFESHLFFDSSIQPSHRPQSSQRFFFDAVSYQSRKRTYYQARKRKINTIDSAYYFYSYLLLYTVFLK